MGKLEEGIKAIGGSVLGFWREGQRVAQVERLHLTKGRLGHDCCHLLVGGGAHPLESTCYELASLDAGLCELVDLVLPSAGRRRNPDVESGPERFLGNVGAQQFAFAVLAGSDKDGVHLLLGQHGRVVRVKVSRPKLPSDCQAPRFVAICQGHQIDGRILKGGQDHAIGQVARADKANAQLALVLVIMGHVLLRATQCGACPAARSPGLVSGW